MRRSHVAGARLTITPQFRHRAFTRPLTKSRLNHRAGLGGTAQSLSGARLTRWSVSTCRFAAVEFCLDQPCQSGSGGMTVSIEWRDECETYDYGRVSGNERPSRVLSRAVLACVALACAFIAWTHLSGGGADKAADQAFDEGTQSAPPSSNDGRSSIASNAYSKLATALKSHMRRSAASASEAALFDSRFSLER